MFTAHSPADLLASIPHNLGFIPTDSLVLVSISAEGKLGATLRIDLDALTTAPHHVAGLMRQDASAHQVAVVIYDNTPDPLRWKEPYLHLVEALAQVNLPADDAWLVADTHFYSLTCQDPDCCPPLPVEAIEESPLNAEYVYRGSAPTEQEPGVETPTPPTGDKLMRMMELIMAVDMPPTTGESTDFTQPAIAVPSLEWWCALDLEELTEEHAATLLAPLARAAVRDRLIGDALSAPLDVDGFKKTLVGASERIDWAVAIKYQRLATRLMAYAPLGQLRSDLLCMSAFVEWHKGRGSTAHTLLVQAQDSDSDHRLSGLLIELIASGILAQVSRSADTAYNPSL